MTRSELQNLIVTRLVREHGGSRQRWRKAINTIQIYSRGTHPHCNWEVRSAGPAADIDAVERMVDKLRHDHAHIDAD
jgi:hypothetical protein